MEDEQEAESSNTTDAVASPVVATVKKRGRPSSKKPAQINNIRGCITKPTDDNNLVEAFCSHINVFKKLPEILKAFNMTRVWIKFKPEGIEITCRDHQRKTYNKLVIPGAAMNCYYYAKDASTAWKNPDLVVEEGAAENDTLYICCIREHLAEIVKYVSESFSEMRILVRRVEKKWYIAIKSNNGCTDINEIPRALSLSYSPAPGMPEYESEIYDYSINKDYPLFFELSQDAFKTLIARAKESNITFSKRGTANLTIESSPKDSPPFWSVYNDPAKINLTSNLKDDQHLAVVVNSSYIKIAGNSSIGFMDKVRIGLCEGKPISLRWSAYDNEEREICYLHTYVEIVRGAT